MDHRWGLTSVIMDKTIGWTRIIVCHGWRWNDVIVEHVVITIGQHTV